MLYVPLDRSTQARDTSCTQSQKKGQSKEQQNERKWRCAVHTSQVQDSGLVCTTHGHHVFALPAFHVTHAWHTADSSEVVGRP